ncbi:MAG TPA: preprotein translocase subunit YajC [Terrimesophilobacter sp.]|nr:preprotein translocase subunit YajC [Terrimesophilobacter sp.]HRP99638.1 preprotein translocase subunit YajC [Terrimesophilobacter sp.]
MPDITLLLLLVVLAAFIYFQFRNSRKRQAEAAKRREAMVPGTEVMTNFGLYGTIVSIDEDENIAVLEISPGVTARVHRQVLLKPAVDEVPDDAVEADETTSGPQLNESNAIHLGEPEYGERINPDDKPKGKGKKSE